MKIVPTMTLGAAVLGGVLAAEARGAPPVFIETVLVGNPGNAGDPIQFQGAFGSVAYVYAIGTYEVTAGQYAAFLNAVAATDPFGLYNLNMGTHADGCRIVRTGSPGGFSYSVAPDWAKRPVNFVSWGDAARFANWMHNGQPNGAPGPATTEDGSYRLDGKMTDEELEPVTRKPGATWVIPTEDEWYKAAYHENDGVTGSYWNYPTAAMNGVSNDLIDPDPGNNATFRGLTGDFTIGPPYGRTEAGAHENSASAYGTFDQGGNVMEFNETVPWTDIRGIRGGSWFSGDIMGKWDRPLDMHSSDEFRDLGFRVGLARVPVSNLRVFDPPATSFEWDPMPGEEVLYDLVRGNAASLADNAGAVNLGPLACIENDSPDASSQSHPDPEIPALHTAFFYLVRTQSGPVVGPWGFSSEGHIRAGSGGCPP